MKRLLAMTILLATAAVFYAAAGDLVSLESLADRFRDEQRLPSLRSKELPFRYPVRLWRDGVEGEVVLRIHITEMGAVDSVELKHSSGHATLDSIAMDGATRLAYHPALEGEEAVAVWAVLPVRFQKQTVTMAPEGE